MLYTGKRGNTAALLTTSRFDHDFQYLKEVARGRGSFGSVIKCKSRIDGCLYAVKKIKRKILGTTQE